MVQTPGSESTARPAAVAGPAENGTPKQCVALAHNSETQRRAGAIQGWPSRRVARVASRGSATRHPHITSAERTRLGSRASERGRETRCSGAALQFNGDCDGLPQPAIPPSSGPGNLQLPGLCPTRGGRRVGRLDGHGSVARTKLPVLWPVPIVTRRDQARGNTSSDGARLRPVRARPSPLPRPRAEPRRPAGLGPV